MFKNVLKDFKSAIRRKYTVYYMIGVVALVLLANIAVVAFRLIYGANEGTYAYNIMEYATWCFVIPYYTCILLADIAFNMKRADRNAGDSKNKTGLGRTQLYLSKLITAFMIGIVFVIFASLVLIVITYLFHITDGSMTLTWSDISDFIDKLLIAFPFWFAGEAFGMMFLFVFDSKKKAFISYFILTLLIPRVIMFFAAEPFQVGFMKFLRTYTITQNFTLLPYPSNPERNVALSVALGFIYTIVATVIGCISYNKKKSK